MHVEEDDTMGGGENGNDWKNDEPSKRRKKRKAASGSSASSSSSGDLKIVAIFPAPAALEEEKNANKSREKCFLFQYEINK